jgi:hypothetical protein
MRVLSIGSEDQPILKRPGDGVRIDWGYLYIAAPGATVSSMVLNPDGTIRSLNGYTEITGVTNTGRDGIDERMFRMGLRLSF